MVVETPGPATATKEVEMENSEHQVDGKESEEDDSEEDMENDNSARDEEEEVKLL